MRATRGGTPPGPAIVAEFAAPARARDLAVAWFSMSPENATAVIASGVRTGAIPAQLVQGRTVRTIPPEERGRAAIDFERGTIEILPVELPVLTLAMIGLEDETSADGAPDAAPAPGADEGTPVAGTGRTWRPPSGPQWPAEVSIVAMRKYFAELVALSAPLPGRQGGRPPHRAHRRMAVIAAIEVYLGGAPEAPADLVRIIAETLADQPDAPDLRTVERFVDHFLAGETAFIQDYPRVDA